MLLERRRKYCHSSLSNFSTNFFNLLLLWEMRSKNNNIKCNRSIFYDTQQKLKRTHIHSSKYHSLLTNCHERAVLSSHVHSTLPPEPCIQINPTFSLLFSPSLFLLAQYCTLSKNLRFSIFRGLVEVFPIFFWCLNSTTLKFSFSVFEKILSPLLEESSKNAIFIMSFPWLETILVPHHFSGQVLHPKTPWPSLGILILFKFPLCLKLSPFALFSQATLPSSTLLLFMSLLHMRKAWLLPPKESSFIQSLNSTMRKFLSELTFNHIFFSLKFYSSFSLSGNMVRDLFLVRWVNTKLLLHLCFLAFFKSQ